MNIPLDLEQWRRWQQRRRGLQGLRSRLLRRTEPEPRLSIAARTVDPSVLLAIDSRSQSGIASLHGLIDRIPDLAVVSSVHSTSDLSELLGSDSAELAAFDDVGQLTSLRAVVASGHYLPAGAAAWWYAMQRGIPNIVVQHGLVTPFAPPLPTNAHVLSFTDADGSFWASGRSDISWSVTGSQLLWNAHGEGPLTPVGDRPYYLGQLHGAELPRRGMARAVSSFWRETGAIYRPHPSEVDRLSRLQHRSWERRGMQIDRSRRPLAELDGPVVAAFSTGIVESAAAGLPAWSHYPDPPRWIEEFWERYSISRWNIDTEPTAAPTRPEVEPAEAIADAVLEIAGGRR